MKKDTKPIYVVMLDEPNAHDRFLTATLDKKKADRIARQNPMAGLRYVLVVK